MSKPTGNWFQVEGENHYQLDIPNDSWTGFLAVLPNEEGEWWAMHANYEIAGGFETPEEAQIAAEEYCQENDYRFEVCV